MSTLNSKQQKLVKRMTSSFTFIPFSLVKIPMLAIAGVRIRNLTIDKCLVTVPFKHINKNPFKSMYFAVQAMAAELSTAGQVMLALEAFDENFAYIVVGVKADFFKKADSKVFFESNDYSAVIECLKKSLSTGDPVVFQAVANGVLVDGTVVSTFKITWSFKLREKK